MITATPGMAPVITGSFMFFPEAALHKAASGGIVKICIARRAHSHRASRAAHIGLRPIGNPPDSHACK